MTVLEVVLLATCDPHRMLAYPGPCGCHSTTIRTDELCLPVVELNWSLVCGVLVLVDEVNDEEVHYFSEVCCGQSSHILGYLVSSVVVGCIKGH